MDFATMGQGQSVNKTLLFLCILICCCSSYLAQNQVTISSGIIIGKTDMTAGVTVKKFLGIPYGQPPVGHLRLEKPVPVTSINPSPYNATYFRPYCVQASDRHRPENSEESEDCLYLNIFAPTTPADEPSGHAVMVWLYGGGFQDGVSDTYDCSALASFGNVIVVTFNYRLGILGFFSTMDSSAPGNYGLFDQHLAIQWVHDNIAAFGGDVNRVTIFGESAGSISAVMQGLYPENQDKIHRVIAQSGSSLSRELIPSDPNNAKELAKHMNCPRYSSAMIVNCIKNLPLKNITSVFRNMGKTFPLFGPVVDGEFMKFNHANIPASEQARDLDEVKFFKSLDLLIGVNAYEGGYFLSLEVDDTENFNPNKTAFIQYIRRSISLWLQRPVGAIASVIAHEYSDWKDSDGGNYRLQFTKMLGDITMVVPTIETARLHARMGTIDGTNGNTFLYYFLPSPTRRVLDTPSWVPGANHADELLFVFGYVLSNQDWQTILATNIIKYWCNFAKTGNPNLPTSVVAEWPLFNSMGEGYLVLDKDMSLNSTGRYLGARETNFWSDVIPSLLDDATSDSECGNVTSVSSKVWSVNYLVNACIAMTFSGVVMGSF